MLSGLSPQAASASSFDGCLRNPQLDGRPLGPPSHTFGVTPCYVGPLESGVFFAAGGGSITLGTPLRPGMRRITFHGNPRGPLLTNGISLPADAVMTEQDLEVTLEVRPRSASGLIFHIGTRRTHHLLLYMEKTKVLGGASPQVFRGEWVSPACPCQFSSSDGFVSLQVTVRASTGADEFSASVTHPALCNGQWHTISGEVTAPLCLCSSSAQPTSPRGAQDKPRLCNLNPIPLLQHLIWEFGGAMQSIS